MKLKVLALVVMLGIVGGVDVADAAESRWKDLAFTSAVELYTNCVYPDDQSGQARGRCQGYILAVMDAYASQICFPDDPYGPLFRQVKRTFMAYSKKHPEQDQERASTVIINAIATQFAWVDEQGNCE